MNEKTLYIAYGSNLNIEQMAQRCPSAKIVGESTIEDYQLLFRGGSGRAVATIEKQEGGKVPVLIWQLEESDEEILDRYEGYPFFYRKEWMDVFVNEERMKAMVYIMNGGRVLGAPSQLYYDTILQGYMSAGFAKSILEDALRVSSRK
ncbi:hypothetical protein EAL2_c19750 [Peptoclostridium acidaminophilum DSM 3953]|uniref:Gamma-glutamylcyclotransferase AIG2-like domain-containing protein n=1 Tax=Peptoclostridium acidaminophilum DSM 3953 TaxID=1286171 RepID=W8U8S3_PEPAC|nr:gamma-glutamylcyclotransferase family protein [Peptoclostridium acidaminophilum]AHM57256.1 hypothetical protein EAL2_c19750 [Peptoclostridium acidaminophilum DSM 3953]